MIRAPLLALSLLAPLSPAGAQTLDGAAVRALVAQAAQAAGHRVSVEVSDRRGFPPCDETPQVRPQGTGWRSVTLTCPATPGWQRILRTSGPLATLSGEAASGSDPENPTVPALVLTGSLPRGTLLTAQHFKTANIPAQGRRGLVTRPGDALGRSLRTNLGAGQPLLARHLSHDWLVRAEEPVAILIDRGGIAIETAGMALEPGQLNQRINVRNRRSGTVLQATVTGRNKVAPLP